MIKIALTGDIFVSRRFPAVGYRGMSSVAELLQGYEVRFGNLETTVHNKAGYPSAFPGGTWAMAEPGCLDDIKYLGINLLSTANNHSMDYSHTGLLKTIDYLREKDLVFSGTGENLGEASKPAFFECQNGRVALISITSSFHDSDAAGNQRIDMPGRPGVNPLRHETIFEVTPDNLQVLERISNQIGINSYHNQAIKEGYLPERENFNFANFEFIKSNRNRQRTYPLEKDLRRTRRSIKEAKKQADFVILSLHSHQFSDGSKEVPAEFIRTFAQECIDAGAAIVVGHGPHILRGIEKYKKGVILYGLGNFIFQNETVKYLPAEFFEKYGLEHDDGVGSAMDKRSKSGTIGLNIESAAWESVIVGIECSEGSLKVRLFPISLGFGLSRYTRGLPCLVQDDLILERINKLSSRFGTSVMIGTDHTGYIEV